MSFRSGPWTVKRPGCGLQDGDELSIFSTGIQVRRAGVPEPFPWGEGYRSTGTGSAEVTYNRSPGTLTCDEEPTPAELNFVAGLRPIDTGTTWTAQEGGNGGGGGTINKPPDPPRPHGR